MPSLTTGLSATIQGDVTQDASLDVLIADTASVSAGLEVNAGTGNVSAGMDINAGTGGREASLDVAVAEPRSVWSKLDAVISAESLIQAGLDLYVASGAESSTELLSVELSPLIAESRNCPVNLDVNIATGASASLDVLIQAAVEKHLGLQVYVKSEDLKIGASALYNDEGHEVESILYVEDGNILHPEYVEDMTATLLYRSKQNLGSVRFDRLYGTEAGEIVLVWTNPAHVDDLSIRYHGTVTNIGAVDFTIEVGDDYTPEIPLGENMLEGVDNEQPRMEVDSSSALTHQLGPAPEEIEKLEPAVQLVLLKINMLSRYEFLAEGQGPLEYTGGGNRLLTSLDNDRFIFQAKDQLPPPIEAHTRIEDASSNLVANSDFLTPTSGDDPVPAGWSLDEDSTVTVLPELVADSSGVNQLKIRSYGSGPYTGPKGYVLSYSSAVAASPGVPFTFSVLGRTDYQDENVNIQTLKLLVSFRDATDTELSLVEADYNPNDIEGNALVLLSNHTASPPLGTTSARVSLSVASIETSDDNSLYLMGPQVENTTEPTSRIVGQTAPTNRAQDNLRVPQSGNLEFRKGSIVTLFAPDYEGQPAADACLFDTRDESGFNGFAAFHRTDGKLEFRIAGPVSEKVVETNLDYEFTAGIFQEVGVSWASDYMQIQLNSEEVAVDNGSLVLPQAYNQWIYLFRTTTNTSRLNGELAAFEVRRDVQH